MTSVNAMVSNSGDDKETCSFRTNPPILKDVIKTAGVVNCPLCNTLLHTKEINEETKNWDCYSCNRNDRGMWYCSDPCTCVLYNITLEISCHKCIDEQKQKADKLQEILAFSLKWNGRYGK